MSWTPQQINEALKTDLQTDLYRGEEFGKIQFNSKDVAKGDVFIALSGKEHKGARRDGHEFVHDALARGAGLAIISQDIYNVPEDKIVRVANVFQALHDMAEYKRQHSKAKFIGVTGSVGKTSTKDIIGLMLQGFGKTFVSRGNFNNHIGVPINLASISNDDEFVVIEMGMSASGEISALTKQVKPDIAVITSVAQSHLEFFDSVEKIADAKSEIVQGLDINHGVAILNRDISTYRRCMENIDILGIRNIKTFGKSPSAHVRLVSYQIAEPDANAAVNDKRVKLGYKISGKSLEFTMPLVPKHMAVNFAAGFAVISALGLDLQKAAQALEAFDPGIGRGKLISIRKDGLEYKVITDYYNANPESMKAGLEYFNQFENQQKIAILGDMLELGKDALKLHLTLVPYIIKSGVKKLFLVGNIIPQIAKDLPDTVQIFRYENSGKLANDISNYIEGQEMIFIKGSKSVDLQKVAEALGVVHAV